MIICPLCKKELTCKKTGLSVRFNENGEHVYSGDLHRCFSCGIEVVITNPNPTFDPDAKTETSWDVWMEANRGYTPSDLNIQTVLRKYDYCNCAGNGDYHKFGIGCM